jgi:hypothetical protein
MPADPVAAGRKGGASKSPAKLAACRKNGFQKVKGVSASAPVEQQPTLPVIVLTATNPKES